MTVDVFLTANGYTAPRFIQENTIYAIKLRGWQCYITHYHQYISYDTKLQVYDKVAVYLLSSELLHKQW